MTYQTHLLVLKEDVLQEVPLFDFTLLPKLDFRVHDDVYLKFWSWDEKTTYGPYTMAREFLNDVHNLNRHFAGVVADRDGDNLLETLLATKVTFAERRAYLRKKKEEGLPLDGRSAGTFYEQDGFLVRLQPSLNHVSSTIVHEFGHALHYQLHPLLYSKSTMVMKEMVAIHTARSLGFKRSYSEKRPDHYEALRILLNLEDTLFKEMSFKQQWELLTSITDHEKLSQEKK